MNEIERKWGKQNYIRGNYYTRQLQMINITKKVFINI